MRRGGRARIVATALGLALSRLGAQEEESLDGLFDDPVEDSVVIETGTDHLRQYVASDKIVFSGYFDAKGGVAAGWTAWPLVGDLSAGFDGTIGLTATAKLYFDARPDPDFRCYGYVTTSMDPIGGAFTWNGFSIGELFIDYTWLQNVFIRMGKHDLAWGQARLFEGVTDIMADAVDGFSLRASLPTVLNGVSAIALVNRADVSSYRQITYALKADEVLWGTLLSLGFRGQYEEGVDALFSIKRVLWGVDILADAIAHIDSVSWYPRALAGFFKEWPRAMLYGEYYYDGTVPGVMDHTAGLALGFKDVLGTPLDLGLKWKHAFLDGSGSATAGLTWKPWKYITATVAVPVAYGSDGSRYVSAANEDVAKRRLAVVVGLEMEVSF